jgi:hypothetical protein
MTTKFSPALLLLLTCLTLVGIMTPGRADASVQVDVTTKTPPPPPENEYVLDGQPTGLTASNGGSVSFVKGAYAARALGSGANASGTATYKFKWVRSLTKPEPPPLTAVVRIETKAFAIGAGPTNDVTVNNGWKTFTDKNDVSSGATEYVVKTSPGEAFEMPISVSASGPAEVRVSVRMEAYKVHAAITNCKWYVSSGTTPTPHVLVGERISGSLSVNTLSFIPNTETETFYEWTVPGTIFKNWDPFAVVRQAVQPAYDDDFTTHKDLKQASPVWYWKANATAHRTVVAQGKLNLSANKYCPKEPTVSDDFQVEVVRPKVSISQLAFTSPHAWIRDKISSSTFAHLGVDIVAPIGSVTVPTAYSDKTGSGGTYAFTQVIASWTRTLPGINNTLSISHQLDGTFPYAFNRSVYAVGEQSKFYDTTSISSDSPPPLSAQGVFKVTIIYKPSSPGSCWVPLRSATWSWRANATSTGSTSSGTRYSGTRTSSKWSDTTDHPTWHGAYSLSKERQ